MATWVNETSQKTGGNITMKVAGGYANVTRSGNTVSGNIGIRFIPSQWTYNSVAGWYGGQRRWAQRSGGGTHTATNTKYYANATDNPSQNYQNKTEVTPWSFSTTVSGTGAGKVTLSIGAGWNGYNPSNGYTKKFDVPYPALTSYTISYNANGGTSTPSSQTKYDGIDLTISGAISHNDTSQNGYTVTFNANNGSTTKGSQTASDTVGWSFSSWKSSATGTNWSAGVTNFSENNTTTLTAQWSTSIKTRGSVTLPTTSQCTRTGYTLLGWSASSTATSATWSPGATYTPDATKTIYAVWKINTYTVTVWPGGGTYDGSTSQKSYTQNYNTTKAMGQPTPPTGHIFAGYYAQGSLSGIANNEAIFEGGTGQFAVYNNSGNGTVTHSRVQDNTVPNVSMGGSSVGYKMVITKAAGTASPGCGGFVTRQNTAANQKYIQIVWAKIPVGFRIEHASNAVGDNPTWTWVTETQGTGNWYRYACTLQCSGTGTFNDFGYMYLIANDGNNSKAVTWEVCASQVTNITNSSSTTYTFNATRSMECFYAPLKYTITYNANGGSGAPGQTVYTYASSGSTNLSSTIPTKTNYDFLGWSTSSTATTATYSAGQAWSLSNASNYVLYAVWRAKAPSAATITITDTVRDKATVSVGYTGVELTNYTVYYRANSTGSYSSKSLGTSSTGTITGLQPNTSYQFYVTATNPGGSKDSSTTTATTKAYLPNANTPTASGTTDSESTIGVSATGDTNAGITNYTLYWAPKPNFGRDLYDMPIKVLSDKSVWARIFYQNVKEGTVLFSTVAEVTNTQTADKYSRLNLLTGNTYKIDGKYEFMLCYPNESGTTYNRWKQTNAPQDEFVTQTSTGDGAATGYEAVHIDWNTNYWGGLTRQNSDASTVPTNTYLSGSVGHANWYYAIASFGVYNRGIPAANALVESTYGGVELWIRVGTLSSAPSSQNMGTSTSTTITGLTEDTDYLIWATATNVGGTISSPSLTIHTPIGQSTVWVKVNGTWVKGKVWYKNSSGTWVKCKKFYTKSGGSWIENKTTS